MAEPFLNHRLYRDPKNGKVFGVCAGIASSFGWETWAVRASVLAFGLMTAFGPVVIAYLVAFFVLDPKPSNEVSSSGRASRFSDRVAEAKSTFERKKEESESISYGEVSAKLNRLKKRVENLEAHVTSEQFTLEREFEKMKNDS
ncbi:envelope stress response membrane protein PspC [Pleionea sediminis]|uniref:envelope stress response membrane protein PspC n=1 Tax=Pleionea sediminis TaxID=2569479 RepID=UPI0013DE607E|nr:envelope stress response membrane protein PspC [Pleionea sediminis]